ncbi:D-alanyl-D-alanine dipeptidase [Enterobacteriaceae bacterium LUAb1]
MMKDIVMIDLAQAFPQLEIDLKYASADNLTGKPIYCHPYCLLHPDTAAALAISIRIAELAGFRLRVYDAYRPRQAQSCLWSVCPDPQYIADPATGSNHSRGTAIDLTLVDAGGNALDMGTEFDDMQEYAHCFHPGLTPEVQRNRLLLNGIMFAGGFVGLPTEWWHFELPHAQRYPLLTDRFACFPPE